MYGIALAAFLALQASPAPPDVLQTIAVTPADQVMTIPDPLREEFEKKVLSTRSPEQRLYRLVDFMLKPDGLGLSYQADANNTVAESYRTRKVNCMAFTMMSLALARAAGLESYAQQINKVMAWDLTGDVVSQSLHANTVVLIGTRKYMLDIAVGSLAQTVIENKISDTHLLALFYGNRAMQYLISGDLASASLWQSEALRHDNKDATLLNNAGVLRQRLQDTTSAERLYLKAIEINSGLGSAVANLVALYRQRGDIKQANVWQQVANRSLRRDPFYHFSQGRNEEVGGNLGAAATHYRRAIGLRGDEPIFHFYLARVYYKLGNLHEADSELLMAQNLSKGVDQLRYQAKRNAMRKEMH